MVIGETLTKCVDWQDRGSCILFGDGAGATLVRPQRNPASGIRFGMRRQSVRVDLHPLWRNQGT
jgi:3-oxoacyl-[acyl-carrier-protein] synthase-3